MVVTSNGPDMYPAIYSAMYPYIRQAKFGTGIRLAGYPVYPYP
jgi:hypothetical protein